MTGAACCSMAAGSAGTGCSAKTCSGRAPAPPCGCPRLPLPLLLPAGRPLRSILTSEDFLAQAAPGEFCFLEDRPIRPFLDRVESMVLYHWNRRYPADLFLDLDPAALGWSLLGREEFPGSSHKKITKEVYRP